MRHILMPRLGLTMEQGTVVRWAKREGESFRQGEIVAEVMTDKATSALEAPFDGRLIRVLVREDETVPVLTPIAETEPET
ncbi:MAG TPA: lipoyl domain-containing protein [Methanomassiliicoccales archaeon]|nr:lipoyl domain-containing protein [Methanomassiliicoccales archaeon]